MATVTTAHPVAAQVEHLRVTAHEVPMEVPESDATLEWSSTTMIAVEVHAGGERGLGYTYGDPSVATMIESKLAGVVQGADALRPGQAWAAMQRAIRNAGRPGVGAMAISAVDVALWDLKAARRRPRRPPAGLPRRRCGLRLGRVHLLRRRPPGAAATGLGGAGHPAREDEGGP
jgi:L-alanine-DL-glutamate epimerase-like enolase superfamily enzyme